MAQYECCQLGSANSLCQFITLMNRLFMHGQDWDCNLGNFRQKFSGGLFFRNFVEIYL